MIIDKMIYNSKKEALEMETKYMLMFDAKLNSSYPKRSMKQYRIDNKEQISNQRKLFRMENKERLNNMDKEYYDDNRERLLKQRQEYYVNNIDKIREYDRKRSAYKLASKRLLSIDETYFQ